MRFWKTYSFMAKPLLLSALSPPPLYFHPPSVHDLLPKLSLYATPSRGPCVESLINHPVCRPFLSMGSEWPLFRCCCLLHVNKKAAVSSSSITQAGRLVWGSHLLWKPPLK